MTQVTKEEISKRIATMKVGFAGGFYPGPPELESTSFPPDPVLMEKKQRWLVDQAARMGATCVQIMMPPAAEADRKELAAAAADQGVELEGMMFPLFPELGQDIDPEQVKGALLRAKEAGFTVVRGAWGRLAVPWSRWAPRDSVAEQRAHIVKTLKAIAPLAAQTGVHVAVENHCDFFGWEWAEIFSEVGGRPWVGAALDTANGFAVNYDANADCEALAEWAVTTHIKDMRMIANPLKWAVPFLPVGCKLGEGNVDVGKAIKLLAAQSPVWERLHLIVEPGWEPEGDIPEAVLPPLELRHQIMDHGVGWLTEFVAKHQSKI
jgi:sugar phosphate isomerase/epimerase